MSVFLTTIEGKETDMRTRALPCFAVVCGDGLCPIILFARRLAERTKVITAI